MSKYSYFAVHRVMRGTLLAGLATVAMVSPTLLQTSQPTIVYAACNPGRAGDFNTQRTIGVYRFWSGTPAGYFKGVQSRLDQYAGYVSTSSDASMAWVQLVDDTNDAWMKAGWWSPAAGSRRSLNHWKTTSGSISTTTSPLGSGNFVFSVQMRSPTFGGNPLIHRVVNGVLQSAGVNLGTYTFEKVQVYGETHSAADQMPGGSANRMDFVDTQWSTNMGPAGQPPSNWQAFNGSVQNSNSSWYDLAGTSTDDFQIWDKACAT